METVAVHAQIDHIDQILDDLTESQRHDSQIISPEPEHRDTDQHAADAGAYYAHQQRQCKAQRGYCNRLHHAFGKYRAGKCSHAHKSRMPQAQLTQDTYRQVQGNRQDHIDAQGDQDPLQKAGHMSGTHEYLTEYIGKDHDPIGDQAAFCRL